jgi:hypothetical protein
MEGIMDTMDVNMDGYKIGPAGQTLGELKADVIAERRVFMAALARGEADDDAIGAYHAAISLLRAAYTRMGLEYVAP